MGQFHHIIGSRPASSLFSSCYCLCFEGLSLWHIGLVIVAYQGSKQRIHIHAASSVKWLQNPTILHGIERHGIRSLPSLPPSEAKADLLLS